MTSRRASEPPAEHEHESAEHDGQPEIGDGGRRAEPALHDGIVGHHLARHVAEDPAAEPYDPLVPAHEIREETTPPHHEGQRQRNADDHEHKVSLGGGGHAEHVVEAHGDVATTMIQIASPSVAPARVLPCSVEPGLTSRMAIQMRASPPRSWRRGIRSR